MSLPNVSPALKEARYAYAAAVAMTETALPRMADQQPRHDLEALERLYAALCDYVHPRREELQDIAEACRERIEGLEPGEAAPYVVEAVLCRLRWIGEELQPSTLKPPEADQPADHQPEHFTPYVDELLAQAKQVQAVQSRLLDVAAHQRQAGSSLPLAAPKLQPYVDELLATTNRLQAVLADITSA